ncbi:MAG: T9SS type A sorting domain-containing protein, partial [Cytophaga sp.]|uniref:T9SS type A sorting domain-containing protein n=1 Tax=Cytophaga sp. TaxID=29535 RepID=UPI003F7F5C38
NNKTNYYVNYDNNLALTNRTITSPEYYNARSYTDYDDPAHGHYYGTIINGVLTASSVTVSQGGYLNLRAGASITLSPPFTASGTMQASIYRPEKNYEWEMSICSDGAPVGNAIPSGHREAAINETNYFSMEDYLASKALEKSDVVTSSLLEDAYPNPAAGTTSIPYKIAAEESVEIFILDANGNKVSTLVKKEKHPTGEYSVDYNTSLLSPGVYYYTLKTASYSKTKKLVIIK